MRAIGRPDLIDHPEFNTPGKRIKKEKDLVALFDMIFAFPLTVQGCLGPGTRREEGSAEAADKKGGEGAEEPTEGAGEEGHSHPGRRSRAGDARGGHD